MTAPKPSSAQMTMPRDGAVGGSRLLDLDCGRGLAIVLVVLGHIAARDRPTGNDWYGLLQFLINSFNMAFFMYLAGYAFFYSGNAASPRPTYPGYAWRRAERLLVPFFAIGALVIWGKLALQTVLHVDNAVSDAASGFRSLI
jgi:fucose 4-O-acetylase-like acetyltransferase